MDAISCLAPPASLLAASFADAALARALHLSDVSASSSSSGSSATAAGHHQHYSPLHLGAADLAYMSAPPVACEPALVSPRPTSSSPGVGGGRRHQLHPLGPRAGKRRSRASKRAPTTYISTDPANFRLMVQHITGAQAEDPPAAFDASSLLLPADSDTNQQLLTAAADHQQQPQQPCFPTLDSWNVSSMYHERSAGLL